jgi:acyl-coenzyme A thioesterase 13
MTGREALLAAWNACGYYRLVGMEVVRADADGSEFRIAIDDRHLQAYGTAHGGVVAGLVDAAMGLAVLARIPADEGCATIEMTLNFTGAARPGALAATGRVLHEGRRIVTAAGEARAADGRLVAVGQGTFQRFAMEDGG